MTPAPITDDLSLTLPEVGTGGVASSSWAADPLKRREWWTLVGPRRVAGKGWGGGYQRRLQRIYRHLVPPGLRVLEIGSGNGQLLASLSPSRGLGVDFAPPMVQHAAAKHPDLQFIQADAHALPLDETFDIIILSDLINDLWDVQAVFERLGSLCHPGTRIILNFYSNLWQLPLRGATRLGLANTPPHQNWLTPADVRNLLHLAGFETIRGWSEILWPLRTPGLDDLCNRWLAKCWLLSYFNLTNFIVARPSPRRVADSATPQFADATASAHQPQPTTPSVSVIVAARNEAGNIADIVSRVPEMGRGTEIIFVEGGSSDDTFDVIEQTIAAHPDKAWSLYRQEGKGKGDAVRLGFAHARGDVLMILDADLTVPPEDLPRFYHAIVSGKAEFANGVRLVYPMQDQAMRFFNLVGNKFFSWAFSWLLEQPIKDTLCGTKVLRRVDYERLAAGRAYFGDFDPFGDFDLLFGAARLNLRIVDIPVRYGARTYGQTNIDRWRHGWLLLRMTAFAARRIKFI